MISYKDLNIGDTIITNDGITGTVQMLKSVAVVNHESKSRLTPAEVLNKGFVDDNNRHEDKWYNLITISVKDSKSYLLSIDFSDVKTVIKSEKINIFTKIKNYFKL